MQSLGILLTNTGSPAAPTAEALRPYLAQFLSDRRVIALPRWLWAPLLHTFVLTFRPARSARLYRNIWTPAGSPLIGICRRIEEKLSSRLADRLGPGTHLSVAMRYGAPSIHAALAKMKSSGVQRLLVLPLFPQYSYTTTESAFDGVTEALQTLEWAPETRKIRHYFSHPKYLSALVSSVQEHWKDYGRPEKLLFSFHGIPESYARAGDPYPDHCRTTASAAAQGLGLDDSAWSLSFQSRFGPIRWLQPYTDDVLAAWGRGGPRHIQVLSPGFSADCLETLDELGREGRDTYLEAGGSKFEYIPALNDRAAHIEALASIMLEELAAWQIHAAEKEREINAAPVSS